MTLPWVRTLARTFFGRRQVSQRHSKTRSACVAIEQLEDRLAPAASLVFDINAVQDFDAQPRQLIDCNGTLFFVASNRDGTQELWKSDGAEAGTALVKGGF